LFYHLEPDICLEEYSYHDFMQAFLIDAIDEFEMFLQYQRNLKILITLAFSTEFVRISKIIPETSISFT